MAWLLAQFLPIAGGVFPKVRDDLIAGVKQGDTRGQIGNHGDALALMKMARHVDAAGEAQVAAIEGEFLQSVVGAVGNQKKGFRGTRIDHQTVWASELAGFLAVAAEGSQELAVRIVLIDVIGAVAISDVPAWNLGSASFASTSTALR